MPPHTPAILSDPRIEQAREDGFSRLQALFQGQPGKTTFVLAGISCYTENDSADWENWLDESLEFLASQAEKSTNPLIFRPLCINFNPHGVHFVDKLFGADVFQMEDGSWQAHPLNTPVGSLQPCDLEHSPLWAMQTTFAQTFLRREARSVIFGLPTIASVLNIAVNLYGQEILAAMVEAPAAARHDLQVIHETLLQIHHWYQTHIPAKQLQCILPDGRCEPVGFGQLCGCTTQLISARTYRSLVAPLDEALLASYLHGGMIHLCGAHTQHLAAWREMKALRALQLNDRAAADLAQYFQNLRSDQILYVNPCEEMPVEQIMDITGGRRTVIAADLPEPPPLSNYSSFP